MSNPKNHHHVAQFLLAGWCRPDGKLAIYCRKNNQVVIDWHSPKYTAFEPLLYSVSALPPKDRQWVEREIMTKAVDDPAAKILHRLLTNDLGYFDSNDRAVWTRFILAQWVRSPEEIAKLRREGRIALREELESNPEEYLSARADSVHATLPEWVDANAPGLDEIFSMTQVLPSLINHNEACKIVINMRWEILNFTGAKIDLLTSDRPVVRLGSLNSRDCLITIPLDPERLFVASHYNRGFNRFAPEKIVKAANRTSVTAARTRVYGSGVQHKPLVEKWLRYAPAALN